MSTKAAEPQRRLLRLFSWCFVVVLVAVATASSVSASGWVVKSLPGFDGPLPFYLETGYVEVDKENGAELFYYFVKSESSSSAAAAADDVPFLLWLTGGDRCSVLSGLAFEIGPVKFVVEPYNGSLPRLQYNQNSWSKVPSSPFQTTPLICLSGLDTAGILGLQATTGGGDSDVSHILFVDSPVGAGFSFSRELRGYDVGDISSTLHLYDFLIKWFSDHPEFLTNPFYIGGDSYAGKNCSVSCTDYFRRYFCCCLLYITDNSISFAVSLYNTCIEAGSRKLPNLKGYLVGNPGTGEIIDYTSRVPYAHGVGIISDQLYETILWHCQGQDFFNPSNALCAQALNTFNNLIDQVQKSQILLDKCVYASPVPNIGNKTDVSNGRRTLREEMGAGELNHPPARPPVGCMTYGYYLSYFWANDRRTREALGIKKGTVDEWVRCHDKELPYTTDLGSVIKYHRNVTTRGYRALVYR
nr:unnamed protein product [Digitaria exilis]